MVEKSHNKKRLEANRKKLRASLTPAEATLWRVLRSSRLDGRKFRRQHSVENYIMDFYCPSEALGIELDGQGHYEDQAWEKDTLRTIELRSHGIRILRFENRLVFEELEFVLHRISSEFGWRDRNS